MVSLLHIDVQSPYGGGSHTTMPNKKNTSAFAGLNTAQVQKLASLVMELKEKLPAMRKRWNAPFFGGKTYEQMIQSLNESKKNFSQNPPARKTKKAQLTGKFTRAPVNLGSHYGESRIAFRGNPQVLTDETGSRRAGGVRVEFTDVLNATVSTAAGQPITGGNLYAALMDGTATDAIGYHEITPSALCRKLLRIADMYEFYAFRSVTFEYVPFDSTSERGSVLMGFVRSSNNYKEADLSMQYIMETEGANCYSVWTPGSVTLTFNGTKVFSCHYGREGSVTGPDLPIGDYIQSLFLCGVAGTSNASLQNHGWIRVSGVCDFYREASVNNTIPFGLDAVHKALGNAWIHSYPSTKLPFSEWIKSRTAGALLAKYRDLSAKSLQKLEVIAERKESH